ncbi:MAG: hypothetical protein AB7D37_04230 [Desulfovibrio sp.]
MNEIFERHMRKVPEVTLTFWIIKIPATPLGETGRRIIEGLHVPCSPSIIVV